MNILVTGATGFVGTRLTQLLKEKGYRVKGTSRTGNIKEEITATGDIDAKTDWSKLVVGCEAVVHTAGRAHILKEKIDNPEKEFYKVNCDATLKLAADAYEAGTSHFIFISSIGVNGNYTNGKPFDEKSVPDPASVYAQSKYQAEKLLLEKYKNSSMAITIIRPALICGVNAPGNIERLLKIVASGVPLPFKNINNKRSMVSLDNVCDFICTCVSDEKSKNEVFVLADKAQLSTGEIVTLMSNGMNKKCQLFYFPGFLMNTFLSALGKKGIYQQLYGTLEVDCSKAEDLLKWTPPVRLEETLYDAGKYFRKGVK